MPTIFNSKISTQLHAELNLHVPIPILNSLQFMRWYFTRVSHPPESYDQYFVSYNSFPRPTYSHFEQRPPSMCTDSNVVRCQVERGTSAAFNRIPPKKQQKTFLKPPVSTHLYIFYNLTYDFCCIANVSREKTSSNLRSLHLTSNYASSNRRSIVKTNEKAANSKQSQKSSTATFIFVGNRI